VAALLPGKNPGALCVGGWVGPRPSVDIGETNSLPLLEFETLIVLPVV